MVRDVPVHVDAEISSGTNGRGAGYTGRAGEFLVYNPSLVDRVSIHPVASRVYMDRAITHSIISGHCRCLPISAIHDA